MIRKVFCAMLRTIGGRMMDLGILIMLLGCDKEWVEQRRAEIRRGAKKPDIHVN